MNEDVCLRRKYSVGQFVVSNFPLEIFNAESVLSALKIFDAENASTKKWKIEQ